MVLVFCIKHRTAYELRISDWSADVCSSDVADEVVALDLERRIIAPSVRIADLRGEGSELLVRLGLGFGRHPVEFVDPRAHRGDDVLDELIGGRLRLGRKIFGEDRKSVV